MAGALSIRRLGDVNMFLFQFEALGIGLISGRKIREREKAVPLLRRNFFNLSINHPALAQPTA